MSSWTNRKATLRAAPGPRTPALTVGAAPRLLHKDRSPTAAPSVLASPRGRVSHPGAQGFGFCQHPWVPLKLANAFRTKVLEIPYL